MKTFVYRKARRIIHWGYTFDSLTELKFAISIREEYEFLRAHIPIYYDPKTRIPTTYIRANIVRYTPDFLIRNKLTGEAFWIEIKPRAYNDLNRLEVCKTVAENYIRRWNYDWQYKVIYDDEIILTEEQLLDFEECKKLLSKSAYKLWFQEYNKKFDRSCPSLFKGAITNKLIHFVMFGTSHRFP